MLEVSDSAKVCLPIEGQVYISLEEAITAAKVSKTSSAITFAVT